VELRDPIKTAFQQQFVRDYQHHLVQKGEVNFGIFAFAFFFVMYFLQEKIILGLKRVKHIVER